MLRGRRTECAELDRLLEALPSGHSAILVLRGEAGYGKTALLEYPSERAAGCRLARAAGVESEMELPSHGIGHPRGRRMVASCSWRPEREAGRLPGVPTDHLRCSQRSGTSAARTLLALAPTTPSYARLRVSRKRTLTPVIDHQLAKAFPPEAIAALRL